MKGTPETLEALETAIHLEAHLLNQYGLNCKDLKHECIKGLASKFKALKKDEICYLERLVKETLMLSGNPVYSVDDLEQYTGVEDMLEDAVQMETALYDFYTEQAPLLRNAGDEAQAHVFQHFCKWHRCHVDELEKELALSKKLGEAGYLAVRA